MKFTDQEIIDAVKRVLEEKPAGSTEDVMRYFLARACHVTGPHSWLIA